MKRLCLVAVILFVACGSAPAGKPAPKKSAADLYSDRAMAIIDAHAKLLISEGRMPADFRSAETVIAQYGWHNDAGDSEPGANPSMTLLRRGGGSFGSYTFYQPAFDQAKRSWWINGVMETGSDILVPVNINAAFTTRCEMWASSDGSHSPPCVNTMKSPIGYKVPYISAYDSDGKHAPIIDATVIDMPKYSDGSLKGTLRLNKKAPGFAITYGIEILPPDYVDMCGCHPGEN